MISKGCKNITSKRTLERKPAFQFPKNEIQILFLNNDEVCVEAHEADSLPCSEILEHLNRDESVFVSRRIVNQETHKSRSTSKTKEDILYFNRI